MIAIALKVSILYAVVTWLDGRILSWQCLLRPIVLAPLTGLLMGDLYQGLLMGAALESVYMGISSIGGTTPADSSLAAVITTAFAIATDAGMDTAIALSIPIGTVMSSFKSILTPIWAGFQPMLTEDIENGKVKKFVIEAHLITILNTMIPTLACFIAVAFGVEGLQAVLAKLPAWVMTGIGAASSMMLAVGFAILTSMIWSKEIGYFFFFGYVLMKYMGLNVLAIAILGAVVAVTIFLQDRKATELENKIEKLSVAGVNASEEEEEFF